MDAADREQLLARLRGVVGERYAFADPYEMRLYQYDASPETALPDIVVIPGTAADVARVVKICADAQVPITARSAASSLAGGTVPVEHGVVITFDFDVGSDLSGRATASDSSDVRPDGSVGTIRVDASDPATSITAFRAMRYSQARKATRGS